MTTVTVRSRDEVAIDQFVQPKHGQSSPQGRARACTVNVVALVTAPKNKSWDQPDNRRRCEPKEQARKQAGVVVSWPRVGEADEIGARRLRDLQDPITDTGRLAREWRHHDVADEERRYGQHGGPENVCMRAIRSERCQGHTDEQERYADTRTAQKSKYDQNRDKCPVGDRSASRPRWGRVTAPPDRDTAHNKNRHGDQ